MIGFGSYDYTYEAVAKAASFYSAYLREKQRSRRM
tara:strand:- start:2258 stop:2362 length:105 start_codon:yes stop_codon:yes gene_type:complete